MVNFEPAKPLFCKDCKWFFSIRESCKAPQLGYNLVTGEKIHSSASLERNTTYGGRCGSYAVWFQLKEVKWLKSSVAGAEALSILWASVLGSKEFIPSANGNMEAMLQSFHP